MMRVRRRHFRRANTRPAVCAYRPYTRLITSDEGMEMFKVGIDIGEIRAEQQTDYDKGYLDGAKAMLRRIEDERAAGGGDL